MRQRLPTLIRIFWVPLVTGVLSFAGLILALLSEGVIEAIAGIAAGSPIAIIALFLRRRN